MKDVLEEYGGFIVETISGTAIAVLLYCLIEGAPHLTTLKDLAETIADLFMGGAV